MRKPPLHALFYEFSVAAIFKDSTVHVSKDLILFFEFFDLMLNMCMAYVTSKLRQIIIASRTCLNESRQGCPIRR